MKPYIVGFKNQIDASNFTVTVNHENCQTATQWTKEYFGLLTVEYINSDFDGNHEFKVSGNNLRPRW